MVFLSKKFKASRLSAIFNSFSLLPSSLFFKLYVNDFPRIHKEDSIYFNYINAPYVYNPVNFETLDSLNTLILTGNDTDFVTEIPRSLLSLKSLKKIDLNVYLLRSEIEFIKKNYPNIELIYDDMWILEKFGIEERRYFYGR